MIKVMFQLLDGQHQGTKASKDFDESTTLKQAASACNIPIDGMTVKCQQEALDDFNKTLEEIRQQCNTNSKVLVVRIFKKAIGGSE